ncbi:MAG: hypothetical protein IH899_15145 [Planctomycetes bacterium]|nr:hypothetical protein [Planctomycetota bacterium]
MSNGVERLRVLITVKTHPIPSLAYDELVCTAGVTENGDFIRLYPIRFRDLPYSQQYKKYQWVEIDAVKHTGRDTRKESYRPRENTLEILGEPIPPGKKWEERAKFALAKQSVSMEELWEQQKKDRTSLGVFRPKEVFDLVISPDDEDWKPKFKEEMKQQRLFESPSESRDSLRKVPWKFRYKFCCDDSRCKRNHEIMIEDWEVGALYWNCVDRGASPQEAAGKVKAKFLDQMCASNRDPRFFVGTVLQHGTWVIIGVFWPPKEIPPPLFAHLAT